MTAQRKQDLKEIAAVLFLMVALTLVMSVNA